MKKTNKKKSTRKKSFKKKINKSTGIIPVLFIVALLALFSEAARTIPAGAFSEKLFQKAVEVPKLSFKLIEKKILNKPVLISNNTDYQNTKDKIIISEENIISKTEEKLAIKEEFSQKKELLEIKKIEQDLQNIQAKISKVQKEITEIDSKKLDQETEVIVAKAPKTPVEEIISKSVDQKIIDEKIVDIPKIEETIEVAEDTGNKILKILDDLSEQQGTGTSINNKNITYVQILQNPNDLDLNLKYAQQQGKMGNYKQTISTLERLNMIYPDNVEIKLYLLSVLVQIDSPEKANTIIEEMKLRRDLEAEDLQTLKEIEEELKDREPSLWALTLSIDAGNVWSDNVNSVSKTRLKKSSDSTIGFNSAKYDSTASASMGISATRPVGEQSSLLINFSHTTSDQDQELDDDSQSYGLTFGLDTVLGNQSLSPYLIMSKTDAMADADSFSFMSGVGGFFSVGERNSINYGYSYTDSKANHNSSDTTANETNAIAHGYTLGHDYILNKLISTSIGLGYTDSDAKVDAGNDAETYDFSIGLNFAFPWAYVSVSNAHSFIDYKKADTSVVSDILRSDYTNTTGVALTKAMGDFFPTIDPNRTLFLNLSYEKLISESNIMNYDYITDSFTLSFSKSLRLNN